MMRAVGAAMGGKGEHSTVYEGADGDAELGVVWDSGHFEGSKVSGKVRKTPAGWSVMRERDAVGTIGRDGVAVDRPLSIDGGHVIYEGEVVARVNDAGHAAGALALVWLGRPDLYGEAPPEAPPPPEAPAPPPAAPHTEAPSPKPRPPMVWLGVGLTLLAAALGAAWLLNG